jgi:hypothetical protein
MKDKKFDAVRMMSEIRDKMSEIYTKDRKRRNAIWKL